MNVGFVGVGKMGVHMARTVMAAGYDLVIHDSSREAAAPLLEKGATWAGSPAEVGKTCRLIITMLPTPPIVEEVALGPSGLKATWQAGDVYVDMSTNSPSVVRKIAEEAAEQGVKMLDSPVSGGTGGADAGTLTLMVGGDAAVLEQVRPVLETMSKNIFHLGDVGCGNIAKLVNNMVGLTCNSACAEGMALGARAGIDPRALYELMTVSTADNWSLRQYPNTVLKRNFAPGFKISLAHKDINLALGLGEELGVPLDVAKAVKNDLAAALANGHGDKNVDAVILSREESTGVTVQGAE
jgi:3-hydroxyisobutyrate dehydrogenase-like beta-hydroxyacid dehydrogenase